MKRILAAVDFSPVTGPLLEHAASLAAAFEGAVTLLHIEAPEPDFVGYGPGPQHERDFVAREHAAHHEQLRELRDSLTKQGIEAHARVIQGPTVEKILEDAERMDADVIVIGSHGHGLLRSLILGSVSEGVIKDASCAVLIVPSQPGQGS